MKPEINTILAGELDRSFEVNLEKYQVYSHLEIGLILRGIQASKQLIRMSFAGTLETVLTSILDVDVEGRQLILEMPAIPGQVDMALKSNMTGFEGVLDRIKIYFTVSRISRGSFQGMPALLALFPERLVRLQRREHFRIPVSNAAIHIPVNVDGEEVFLSGSVRDLSPSGLCLIDGTTQLENRVGTIYPDCRLDLPETQSLLLSFEVRNSHDFTAPDGSRHRRIGGQFVNLSSAKSALIQRYITRLEKQQKLMSN